MERIKERAEKVIEGIQEQFTGRKENIVDLKRQLLKCSECGTSYDNMGNYYGERMFGYSNDRGYCSWNCEVKGTREIRAENIDSLMSKVGIPPKFIGITTDASEWIPLKKGLYIHGFVGTGKTVLACNVVRQVIIEEGVKPLEPPHWDTGYTEFDIEYISCPKFIIELQSMWRKEGCGVDVPLRKICQKDLLVIDDIGAEKMTDFVRQSLYYIINEREQWERRTIITSNFNLSQLDTYIDGRISSRIGGTCDIVELKGSDRRLRGK